MRSWHDTPRPIGEEQVLLPERITGETNVTQVPFKVLKDMVLDQKWFRY